VASRKLNPSRPFGRFLASLTSRVTLRSTVETVVGDVVTGRDLDETTGRAARIRRTADVAGMPLTIIRFTVRPDPNHGSDSPESMIVTARDTSGQVIKFASRYPSVMRWMLAHRDELPLPAVIRYRPVGSGGYFHISQDISERTERNGADR
jgi:hypothetical protein